MSQNRFAALSPANNNGNNQPRKNSGGKKNKNKNAVDEDDMNEALIDRKSFKSSSIEDDVWSNEMIYLCR